MGETEVTRTGGGNPFLEVPPQDLSAEISVLGSILLDNDVFGDVIDLLNDPEMFYQERHRHIYTAMILLLGTGVAIDYVTLMDQFSKMGLTSDDYGGLSYLTGLADSTPTSVNAALYARIVHNKYIQRTLVNQSGKIAMMALDDSIPVTEMVEKATQMVTWVGTQSGDRVKYRDREEVAEQALEQLLNSSALYIPTGFRDLDALIGGVAPGKLYILGGRPSMGKSALAMQISAYIASLLRDDGLTRRVVAVIQLEMSSEEADGRLITSMARVDSKRILNKTLTAGDVDRLTKAKDQVKQLNFRYFDDPTKTINEILRELRVIHRTQGLDFVMMDYLQLCSTSNPNHDEQQRSSIVSRALKLAAREFNCPVMCLSQLSRKVEDRIEKRPVLSDLRASGSIEQDADVVMFVYRDEYYNPDTPNKGICEVLIPKHRGGPVGQIELQFHSQHVRFNDLARGMPGSGPAPTGKPGRKP